MKTVLIRHITLWCLVVVFALVLAGCGQQPAPAPAQTQTVPAEDLVATIVVQTLIAQATLMPPTATLELPSTATLAPTLEPTLEPTATQAPASPTPEPSATQTAVPQPTSTPPASDPRTSLGAPNFTDAMNSGTYWPTDTDRFTSARFANGHMVLTALTDTDGWRLMTWPSVEDFYVEISGRFEACSGSDHFGMIVRVPDKSRANQGYLFGVSCDGRFTFNEWDGSAQPNGSWTSHIWWKSNSAIRTGAGEVNRLGILATGDLFSLYVNGVKVGEVTDSTFDEGFVGVYVGSDETNDLTVLIDELNLWER